MWRILIFLQFLFYSFPSETINHEIHHNITRICPSYPLSSMEQISHPLFPSDLLIMKQRTTKLLLHHPIKFLIIAQHNQTAIRGITFQARLFGTAIIHIPYEEICDGIYVFLFEIYDPGDYRLQIRISWFKGTLDYLDRPLHQLESEYHHDPLQYLDATVYDRPIVVLNNPRYSQYRYQLQKPRCTDGDEKPGRWVRLKRGDCPSWACFVDDVGQKPPSVGIKWLTDHFLFNNNYLWVPLHCSYRLYSPQRIKSCLVQKNISDLFFIGDSLLREHFQNTVSYLFPGYFLPRLQGTLETLKLPIELSPNSHFTFRAHYSYGNPSDELCSYVNSSSSFLLWNLQSMRFLNRGPLAAAIERAKWTKELWSSLVTNTCHSQELISNTFLIHPRVQRLDPRVSRHSYPHGRITPFRQNLLTSALLKALRQAFGTPKVLHGLHITDPRWESSWDGIHYSLLAHESDFNTSMVFGPNGISQTSLHTYILTNSSAFRRGGNDMCHLNQYPETHNVCSNGTMYWKTRVLDRQNLFDSFQGGVSRMLTMMLFNSICD